MADEQSRGPQSSEPASDAPTVRLPEPTAAPAPAPAHEAAGGGTAAPPLRSPTRRRWPRLRFLLVGLGLVALALYLGTAVPRWIAERTLGEARQHGIELELGEVDLAPAYVRLRHCRFSLVGLDGVDGYVELLQVDLDDLTPTRIEARGVRLEIEGSAAALALELSEWTKNYPGLARIPAKAVAVDVTWRPQPGERDWLEIDDAVIEPTPTGGTFAASRVRIFDIEVGFGDAVLEQTDAGASVTASRVEVAGVELGKVGASWSGDGSRIALGFGEEDLGRAPVSIDVAYAAAEPQATITLRPTALERLASPLGVALPIAGVTASGRAVLRLAGSPTEGVIQGELRATFEGYSPPVPRELGSFVFGRTTELETKLALAEDRRRVELEETKVRHGAFALAGRGHIERHPDHAAIRLELGGKLRCTDLADAAARSRIGGAVGSLLGSAAQLTLKGSVAVGLKIEADSRDLAAAKLTRTVGIGCNIRALSELPLPELPAGFPSLPELPSLGPSRAREESH